MFYTSRAGVGPVGRCGRCVVFTDPAGTVYSQFQYIEHKAGLVLCVLKLAIHRAGEISLQVNAQCCLMYF